MTEILELLKVYKDFGVAGLFLCLYLITVYFFYKNMQAGKIEAVAMTERVVLMLDKAANAINEMSRVSMEEKASLDQMRSQNNEFISFLRGRDERRIK